ncbi:MAG: hypothetical protein A4E19_15290 [Nitrospira sp. SG-bin1]|nr:MAG: hypothetical protein A4E19_15290 [Nitrospira sp. SG-bin1]
MLHNTKKKGRSSLAGIAVLRSMSEKPAQDSTTHTTKTQTPFDRFKDALSIVASVPKSSLPKTTTKKAKPKK